MKDTINLRMNDFPKLSLKHCPFCASDEAVLENTWTASYWVECDNCSAQIHSDFCGDPKSKKDHKKSALSVIDKWNSRY